MSNQDSTENGLNVSQMVERIQEGSGNTEKMNFIKMGNPIPLKGKLEMQILGMRIDSVNLSPVALSDRSVYEIWKDLATMKQQDTLDSELHFEKEAAKPVFRISTVEAQDAFSKLTDDQRKNYEDLEVIRGNVLQNHYKIEALLMYLVILLQSLFDRTKEKYFLTLKFRLVRGMTRYNLGKDRHH